MPASDAAQHVTYLEALQTLNGSGPNQFGKYKSAYMKKTFPASQAEAIYKWLNTTPPGLPAGDMSQSLLQVDSYGGAVNRRTAEATADTLRVSGTDSAPKGTVETQRDHRIAMAFAVLNTVPGARIRLSEKASVAVSYPGFFDQLRQVLKR